MGLEDVQGVHKQSKEWMGWKWWQDPKGVERVMGEKRARVSQGTVGAKQNEEVIGSIGCQKEWKG